MYLYFEVEADTDTYNFRGEASKKDIESFASVQARRGLKTYMASSPAHELQTKNLSGSSLRKRNAVLVVKEVE